MTKHLLAALVLTGCAATAESVYTGKLLRCVDTAATRAESKACRRDVDAEYGVTVTVTKDGGR